MSKVSSKIILNNIIAAVLIVVYFLILILANKNMKPDRLLGDIEIFAIAFLISGIVFIEKAYKEDSGKTELKGIELLLLSFHTLSIMHISAIMKIDVTKYLLISAGVIAVYYIIKAIIIYTIDRKRYLNSLSDISKIINEDEPIIKEATKKLNRKTEVSTVEDEKQVQKGEKEKTSTKRKTNSTKKVENRNATTKKSTTRKTKKVENEIKEENNSKEEKEEKKEKEEQKEQKEPKTKKATKTTKTTKTTNKKETSSKAKTTSSQNDKKPKTTKKKTTKKEVKEND